MHRRQLQRADQAEPAGGDDPQQLIRLIDELRALDLERRKQPVKSAAFRELVRRVEAKAREVFQAAAARSARPVEAERRSPGGIAH